MKRSLRFILMCAGLGALVSLAGYARPAEFEVIVRKDVMVPMRDGVKLATDLYLPAKDGKRLKAGSRLS
jgi:predicted acyl esterase